MYTAIDIVSDAEAAAEAEAMKDRERYRPFLEAAERYAADNELIVGGASATARNLAARAR